MSLSRSKAYDKEIRRRNTSPVKASTPQALKQRALGNETESFNYTDQAALQLEQLPDDPVEREEYYKSVIHDMHTKINGLCGEIDKLSKLSNNLLEDNLLFKEKYELVKRESLFSKNNGLKDKQYKGVLDDNKKLADNLKYSQNQGRQWKQMHEDNLKKLSISEEALQERDAELRSIQSDIETMRNQLKQTQINSLQVSQQHPQQIAQHQQDALQWKSLYEQQANEKNRIIQDYESKLKVSEAIISQYQQRQDTGSRTTTPRNEIRKTYNKVNISPLGKTHF